MSCLAAALQGPAAQLPPCSGLRQSGPGCQLTVELLGTSEVLRPQIGSMQHRAGGARKEGPCCWPAQCVGLPVEMVGVAGDRMGHGVIKGVPEPGRGPCGGPAVGVAGPGAWEDPEVKHRSPWWCLPAGAENWGCTPEFETQTKGTWPNQSDSLEGQEESVCSQLR